CISRVAVTSDGQRSAMYAGVRNGEVLFITALLTICWSSLEAAEPEQVLQAIFARTCIQRVARGGGFSSRCPNASELIAHVDFCTAPPTAGDDIQPITLAGLSSPLLARAAALFTVAEDVGWPVRIQLLEPAAAVPSGSSGVASTDNYAVAAAVAASWAVPPAPWDLAPYADGWLVDSIRVGEAQLGGYAADLSYGVDVVEGLSWYGIAQAWRDLTGLYNFSAYAVPLGGGALQLLYRKDVLDRNGVTQPP
ncbi:hypothetical protein Vretifemale_5936, partial [Volvox reticuliferus]